MKKYKDSFETRSESLEQGGEGILTAVANKDPNQKPLQARAPEFTTPINTSNVSPIRTLADDLENTVKSENITLAKHVLSPNISRARTNSTRGPESNHETARYRSEKRATRKRGPSVAVVVLFFIALLLFGGSLVLFASKQGISIGNIHFSKPTLSLGSFFDKETAEDIGIPFPEKLLTTDAEEELRVGNEGDTAMLRDTLNAVSARTPENELVALFPVRITATEEGEERIFEDISTLFTLLSISADSALARNIDTYTFGTRGGEEAQAFLVAHVRSYDEAFGAMFAYENDIARDLYGFFHNNLRFALYDEGDSLFHDIVVSGNDARVVTEEVETTDSEGRAALTEEDVLTYAIVSDNILVITQTREALAHIILELN